MSGRRQITVCGRAWLYHIGTSYLVAKAEGTGQVRKISLADLTGMTNAEIERQRWKRSFCVTPKQVAGWLGGSN